MDGIEGFLEVGINDRNEVVINHPDLKPDEHGVGHIVFSVAQARHLSDQQTFFDHQGRPITAEGELIEQEKDVAGSIPRAKEAV